MKNLEKSNFESLQCKMSSKIVRELNHSNNPKIH